MGRIWIKGSFDGHWIVKSTVFIPAREQYLTAYRGVLTAYSGEKGKCDEGCGFFVESDYIVVFSF